MAGKRHGGEKFSPATPPSAEVTVAYTGSGAPSCLETIETTCASQVDDPVSIVSMKGCGLIDTSSSGRERPWNEYKARSKRLGDAYGRIAEETGDDSFARASAAVASCGDYLEFIMGVDTETGEEVRRLKSAHFCRDRLCPVCQWRRSLVLYHEMMRCMEWVDEHCGRLVPLFLTLTVRNVEDDELANALDGIMKAFSRMLRWAGMKRRVKGSYRAVEVTKNSDRGTWHPHIHAVLLVPPEYFTDSALYLDKQGWIREWRRALGVDYDPSIAIGVLGKDGDRGKAILEVCKYSVKPGDWEGDSDDETDNNVAVLRNALRDRRLVSMTGVLRDAKAALKLEDAESDDADLVNTGDDSAESVVWLATEFYKWSDVGYVCARVVVEPGVVLVRDDGTFYRARGMPRAA